MIPIHEVRLSRRCRRAVARQLKSGWIGPGKTVAAFERELSECIGVEHVIATTSGTVGLYVALLAAGIRPKHKVMFPAYTNLAGANAAAMIGARVQLRDIDPSTLCMMKPAAEHEVNAVIFVDHNGNLSGINEWRNYCTDREIPLIEDACQALGYIGAGRAGDLAIFSFSPMKLVTTGQGGAIATGDSGLAAECRRLIDHGAGGWRQTGVHLSIGLNLRMTDLQAALGLAQLRDWTSLIEARNEVRTWYSDIGLPADHWQWCVTTRSERAAELMGFLRGCHIQAAQFYQPVNLSKPFMDVQAFPNAEEVARTVVYLPSSPWLTENQVRHVCNALGAFGEK